MYLFYTTNFLFMHITYNFYISSNPTHYLILKNLGFTGRYYQTFLEENSVIEECQLKVNQKESEKANFLDAREEANWRTSLHTFNHFPTQETILNMFSYWYWLCINLNVFLKLCLKTFNNLLFTGSSFSPVKRNIYQKHLKP